MFVCVNTCRHVIPHMWRSENHLRESSLLCHVGCKDRSQNIILGSKLLYPQSHLTDLRESFFELKCLKILCKFRLRSKGQMVAIHPKPPQWNQSFAVAGTWPETVVDAQTPLCSHSAHISQSQSAGWGICYGLTMSLQSSCVRILVPMMSFVTLYEKSRGWGNGSGCKVFAVQTWRPMFKPSAHMEKVKHSRMCLWPKLWGGRDR